jgi:hypothetical protein
MSWRKKGTLAQTCEGGLLAIADLGDEDWEGRRRERGRGRGEEEWQRDEGRRLAR